MLKSDFSNKHLHHEVMRNSLHNMFNEGAYLTQSVAYKILKLFSDRSLVDKIKVVTDRFQTIFQRESKGERFKESGLTKTQTTVLQKIVDGMTTAQMAREMGVTENTINSHIKAIYATLEVHSRALAIKKAMELKGMR
jgi:DNA-binding NarL/FixJ family response regulator